MILTALWSRNRARSVFSDRRPSLRKKANPWLDGDCGGLGRIVCDVEGLQVSRSRGDVDGQGPEVFQIEAPR